MGQVRSRNINGSVASIGKKCRTNNCRWKKYNHLQGSLLPSMIVLSHRQSMIKLKDGILVENEIQYLLIHH